MAKTPCKGKTRAGVPCQAPALPGGLCYFHGNPDQAKVLGRQGGQKNRRSVGMLIEVPTAMTAEDSRSIIAQTIQGVLQGDLRDRAAVAVAQLINIQLKILPLVDLESRMTRLEQQIREAVVPARLADLPIGRQSPVSNNREPGTNEELHAEQLTQQQEPSPESSSSEVPTDNGGPHNS